MQTATIENRMDLQIMWYDFCGVQTYLASLNKPAHVYKLCKVHLFNLITNRCGIVAFVLNVEIQAVIITVSEKILLGYV